MTNAFARIRLERLLAERTALGTTLDDRCAKLLAQFRKQCPGAVPPPAPEPGGVSEPVAVKGKDLDPLLRAALSADTAGEEVVLLTDGDSELLVNPARSRALIDEGLVLVVLGVNCDQTGPAEVVVPFAVGSEGATAGMIMTTERVPRGPVVVDRPVGRGARGDGMGGAGRRHGRAVPARRHRPRRGAAHPRRAGGHVGLDHRGAAGPPRADRLDRP